MGTYRQKTLASLCLLLAVAAVAAGAVLMRPPAAEAARHRPRQFIFGPLGAKSPQLISFHHYNSGTRPTPPATFVLRQSVGGPPLATTAVGELPPGEGTFDNFAAPNSSQFTVVATVTFDPPTAGQAIPSPYAGTLSVRGPTGDTFAVLYPAR